MIKPSINTKPAVQEKHTITTGNYSNKFTQKPATAAVTGTEHPALKKKKKDKEDCTIF